MALSNNYTVYKHTNKINGKVYIGITSQNVERRWQNGAGYAKTYFGNAIEKYGWNNFEHEILFTGLTKEMAWQIEINLIEAYKSNRRENGYNIAEGGQTADVVRVKSGEENPRAAAVRRINQETGEAVVFGTIKAAADSMKINYRGISKACRGITQTYKGYVWEYVNAVVKKNPPVGIGNYDHAKQRKKIKMIEPDGTERIFDSINEAGATLGLRPNTITRYLLNLRKDSSGRGWLYCL